MFDADLVQSALRLMTPLLFATIASALCNRAGVLNLAIEGKMLLGCFVGIVVANAAGNGHVGIVAAALAGAALGGLMFVLMRAGIDVVVFAIGANLLILSGTVYVLRTFLGDVGTWRAPDVRPLPPVEVPVLRDLPGIGDLLSGYNVLVYLSWLAAVAYWALFKTVPGRRLLAVGEMPAAATDAGISVARTHLWVLLAAGALSGVGGAFLSVGNLGMFTRDMTDSRGWLAVTAALLALSRPLGVVLAAALFGFADALAVELQAVTDVPPNLVQFLPQVAALVALVAVGVRTSGVVRRHRHRPAARGRPPEQTPAPVTAPISPKETP